MPVIQSSTLKVNTMQTTRAVNNVWHRPRKTASNYSNTETQLKSACEVDKDGIHLFVRVGSEEANGGTNET